MNGLNWDKEFALLQTEGDDDLLQELLVIFKKSCTNDIMLIKDGIDAENTSQVCRAAHSIKGAAASLGMSGLRDLALSIEMDAKNNSLVTAKVMYVQLAVLIDKLKEL